MPTQEEIFRVESNTQLEYKNLLIGVAGIWEEEFTDSTGVTRNGVTAGLWIYVKDNRSQDQSLRVYVGQEFPVEQYKISVVDIEQGSKKPIVTLKISEP